MLKKLIGRTYLRVTGWRLETPRPAIDKYVAIAAPHTSNWDGAHMIAMAWVLGIKFQWMGKDSLFRFPFGWVMRSLGGVPIDRSKRNNVVQSAVEVLNAHDRFILAVPPEGTRGRGQGYWRSGFYHITCQAKVPLIVGYLDYSRKRGGLLGPITLSGDVHADMEHV